MQGAEIVSTDVCSVLKRPQSFVNQVIRIRGFVILGEDHMNISDRACPGHGIELVIKSEATLDHKDIHQFYVQMNHQGRVGIATITGLLQADPDPLTPYVLNIQHVKDVAPRSVAPRD
jgi:hypothetical protein